MDIVSCGFKDDQTALLPGASGLTPDAHGSEGEQAEQVVEFQVPWMNAQGSIQMIRAYLC